MAKYGFSMRKFDGAISCHRVMLRSPKWFKGRFFKRWPDRAAGPRPRGWRGPPEVLRRRMLVAEVFVAKKLEMHIAHTHMYVSMYICICVCICV